MSAQDFTGFGFAVGSVFGLRSFGVDELCRLKALNFPDVWAPGELEYVCKKDGQVMYDMWSMFAPSLTFRLATGDYDPETKQRKVKAEPAPYKCPGIEACACGFYGYFGNHNSQHVAPNTIEGVIEAYGKVVMGTKGFRAEKARMVALCVPPVKETKPQLKGKRLPATHGTKLRRNYADLPIFETVEQMLSEFPLTEAEEPSPATDPEFWTRTVAL